MYTRTVQVGIIKKSTAGIVRVFITNRWTKSACNQAECTYMYYKQHATATTWTSLPYHAVRMWDDAILSRNWNLILTEILNHLVLFDRPCTYAEFLLLLLLLALVLPDFLILSIDQSSSRWHTLYKRMYMYISFDQILTFADIFSSLCMQTVAHVCWARG